MLHSILSFLTYFGTALLLLVAFVAIYVRVTPYRDFEQIARDNRAAAIVLSGAVQLLVFVVLRGQAKRIEEGHVAPAILVATFSIAAGVLAAASISV